MPKPRGGTSYRLSEGAQELLHLLAGRLGLTKTAVLEMAIRKLAHAELGEATSPVHPRAGPAAQLPSSVVAHEHKA